MTLSDLSLLGKKILVGVIVTLVPFVIIVGGLWLTESLLGGQPGAHQSTVNKLKPTAYENGKSH
jgi:hypothetical protein